MITLFGILVGFSVIVIIGVGIWTRDLGCVGAYFFGLFLWLCMWFMIIQLYSQSGIIMESDLEIGFSGEEENEEYNLPCPHNPKVKCIQYPDDGCGCDWCTECSNKLREDLR